MMELLAIVAWILAGIGVTVCLAIIVTVWPSRVPPCSPPPLRVADFADLPHIGHEANESALAMAKDRVSEVTQDEFVRAVSVELMDRFQVASIDGLRLSESEAQALARGSWIRLLAEHQKRQRRSHEPKPKASGHG